MGGPVSTQSGIARRILLADEEPVFLEGLSAICARNGLTVVGAATVGDEVAALAARVHADVAVLGLLIFPPGGLEVARKIAQVSPETKVLLLTSTLDERRLADAWRTGVKGVVLRGLSADALLRAIQEVAAGRTYIGAMEEGELPMRRRMRYTPVTVLTSRERDVLALIAEGKTVKEIAARLFISPKTAEHHRARICGKLGVRTTAHLVRFAVRLGLIAP
jgi:DNA-binding NarL/FixJ family response regulator